jgi:hypothetical protein
MSTQAKSFTENDRYNVASFALNRKQITWSRSCLSESGLPQAYLWSELEKSATGRKLMLRLKRKNPARLKSAVTNMCKMVWRLL